ncbi:MAG TPA: DoxX family protein [Gemmatimonadales bacterium]|nr:DoxX family protein [Gemmatimonadales bacterium]
MSRNSKKANHLLWTVQILLAALFIFAGGFKLVMPLAAMQQGPITLPGVFLRFIGVAELLGGLGLVLPGLFRVLPQLTPLAAAGLVTIMAGATTLTVIGMGVRPALFPLVVGILAAIVCLLRGDAHLKPHGYVR